MSEAYQEIIHGEQVLRLPPGRRHEIICSRLHAALEASVANIASTRLLPVRSSVRLGLDHEFRPDIALITAANNRLWLAVEVISSDDHKTDTVHKKEAYETARVPRLWMADPRYDNVEVYHSSEHGLVLKGILAGRETLAERLLPEFQIVIEDLFDTGPPP
ncbi:MAG TPA: Uma2 family endonuclease [Verrucomicrobiota bacterium]|nr:Uma2 family endonuclease [Verrucomicrobiota bacterium]